MHHSMHPCDQKVLLVDDDTAMLELLRSGLSVDKDRYEIVCAKDAQEAIDYLERVHFAMVIADIQMPNLSGLDLLAKIRERWPRVKLILMTGTPTPALEEEIQKSGCLRLFRKPVRIPDLRALVTETLAETNADEKGFAGRLTNIKLSDLIQMCCASGISTVIQVRKNSAVGTIFIEEGEIIHADCDDIEGLDAFFKIFSWQSGSFETLGDVAVPKTTIDSNWQYLLMEGHRRMDEARAAHAGDGPEQNESEAAAFSEECLQLSVDDPGGNAVTPMSGAAVPGERSPSRPAVADPPPIRVLVVDDSAVMCRVLAEMLSQDGGIRVVGTAHNGEEALAQIDRLQPDLITLDVNMPVMDGSTALKHIMIRSPCPVIIVSAADQRHDANVLDFLFLGAVDYVPKPSRRDVSAAERLVDAARRAAGARTDRFRRARPPRPVGRAPGPAAALFPNHGLVLVSSGAGGYVELIKLVPSLPPGCGRGMVVLQYMPQSLSRPFADYLDQRSHLAVRSPDRAEAMLRGHCYLVSNRRAGPLDVNGSGCLIGSARQGEAPLSPGEAAEALLASAADIFGERLMLVLLSGAEAGSLKGLRHIRQRGGRIISQDVRECLVPHPLKAAIRTGLVSDAMGVREIVAEIDQLLQREGAVT